MPEGDLDSDPRPSWPRYLQVSIAMATLMHRATARVVTEVMHMEDASKLWAGKFDDGEVVVFDPHRQRRDEPGTVVLWSDSDRKYSGYDRQIARATLHTVSDRQLVSEVLARYAHFVRAEIEAHHSRRLFELDLPNHGVRSSQRRHPRFAKCHYCKCELDSTLDLECVACGWILCDCGACGCGYDKRSSLGRFR